MDQKPLYHYTIDGQPMVKKNTQRAAFRKRKDGRQYPTIYYTKAFNKWQRGAIADIMDQPRPRIPIDQPIILLCTFFIQQHNVVDISALYEGIQDVLVKCEVLADDIYTIVLGHDGSRVYVDPARPRMTVSIVPMGNNPASNPFPGPKIDEMAYF